MGVFDLIYKGVGRRKPILYGGDHRTIFDELLSAPKTSHGIRRRVARAGHRDVHETAGRNR
jgi:hypothetical protein